MKINDRFGRKNFNKYEHYANLKKSIRNDINGTLKSKINLVFLQRIYNENSTPYYLKSHRSFGHKSKGL